MAGRGVLFKGGFFSVWKFLLTALFVLTVGASANERAVLPASGGYRGDIRGVVVMYARDDQLDSVLYTMNQLQGAHDNPLSNARFSKDWVFYSDRAVSDRFKALTSNLTRPGTAYYELWSLASWGWNLPVLAQHKRLREYNWAWCITPGTEFHSKVDFDSFEAMRSAGMIYGSSSSGHLRMQPESTDSDDSKTERGFPRGIREVQWRIEKGASSRDVGLTVLDDPDQFRALSTDFGPSWLAFVSEMCNACWDFEIAWLDVFRNLEYLKIANYIRSGLKKDPARDDTSAAPTSPTAPSPESQPEQTGNSAVAHVEPGPACPHKAARTARARSGVFYLLGNPDEDISAVHERWMQMTDDFDEKLQKAPPLRSGRTSLFYRETVFTTKGRRARAWLFRGKDKIRTDLMVFVDDGRCARGLKSVYCDISELPFDGIADFDDFDDFDEDDN